MTEIYAVLWDMDGVLVDTTELHYQSWNAVLQPYDLGSIWSHDFFIRTFGWGNTAIINKMFNNPDEAFIDKLANEKEIAFRASIPDNVPLLPGVRDWLARFHSWGWPQAIVSSAPVENIDALIDETGIRGDFQALISATSMPSKPDPTVYLEGARRLGVPPARCIVVEDAPAGVEGANRAGMKSIAVATTRDAGQLTGATRVVNRLTDLTEEDVKQVIS